VPAPECVEKDLGLGLVLEDVAGCVVATTAQVSIRIEINLNCIFRHNISVYLLFIVI
jgi:hypothetical protein